MITKDFVLAGNAIFTVEVDNGYAARNDSKPHFTYRVTRKDASEQWKEAWLVSLLSGPENISDYTYMGLLLPGSGELRLTQKSAFGDNTLAVKILRRVLYRLWDGTPEAITEAGWDVHHIGRCGRCGRELTVPESIKTGLGPECARRVEEGE